MLQIVRINPEGKIITRQDRVRSYTPSDVSGVRRSLDGRITSLEDGEAASIHLYGNVDKDRSPTSDPQHFIDEMTTVTGRFNTKHPQNWVEAEAVKVPDSSERIHLPTQGDIGGWQLKIGSNHTEAPKIAIFSTNPDEVVDVHEAAVRELLDHQDLETQDLLLRRFGPLVARLPIIRSKPTTDVAERELRPACNC